MFHFYQFSKNMYNFLLGVSPDRQNDDGKSRWELFNRHAKRRRMNKLSVLIGFSCRD